MKKIYVTLAALAVLTACKKEVTVEQTDTPAGADTIAVQEPVQEQPMDSVAEMKAWEAYMTPGEPHKMLADETGKWNVDMTFWHGPDSQPQKATSKADAKMILDGRYQEMNYKGDVMGMPFEGRSTVAYDNTTKEYISTWIDNMGTGMMVMKGKMGSDNKTIEFNGEMVDPASGKAKKIREVYTIVDENTRKMEMFDTSGSKEHKSMELVMTRS